MQIRRSPMQKPEHARWSWDSWLMDALRHRRTAGLDSLWAPRNHPAVRPRPTFISGRRRPCGTSPGVLSRPGGRSRPALAGTRGLEWLERLDAEADNLRSALDWASRPSRRSAIRLAVALNWYWRSRSVGSEALDFLARASNLARRLPPPCREGIRERNILLSRVFSAEAFHIAIWSGGTARSVWPRRPSPWLARSTTPKPGRALWGH